jgi:hypothetical protein
MLPGFAGNLQGALVLSKVLINLFLDPDTMGASFLASEPAPIEGALVEVGACGELCNRGR